MAQVKLDMPYLKIIPPGFWLYCSLPSPPSRRWRKIR